MKKIIIIALALLAFSGCDCDPCSEQQQNESRYLPAGAVLLKEYCLNQNKNCDYKYWAKWKFENECFISYDMNRQDAVLTKVSCEEID